METALADAIVYGGVLYLIYGLVAARRRYHGQPPAGPATWARGAMSLLAGFLRRFARVLDARLALWLARRRYLYVREKLLPLAEAARTRGHFLGAASCRRTVHGRWLWTVDCLAPGCTATLELHETVSLDARGVCRHFHAAGPLYTDDGPCASPSL